MTPYEQAMQNAAVGKRVQLQPGYGYRFGQDFGCLSQVVEGAIKMVRGSKIWVEFDVGTPMDVEVRGHRCEFDVMATVPDGPGLVPSGEAQRLEKAKIERKVSADIETLIAVFLASGKEATMAEFDRVAKKRRMKSFEAHMLVVGFHRECAARGIVF